MVDDLPEAEALAELLSIAGHPLPIPVIRELLPEGSWRPELIDDAVDAGLLCVATDGTVALASERSRPVTIGFVRHAQRRAAIGRALDGLGVVPPHVVAHHRLAGVVVEPDPDVIPAAIEIARHLVRGGDYDTAIELSRAILAALDHGAAPTTARVDALGGLAAALAWSNRRAEADELFSTVHATAARTGDPVQLAAAALTWSGRTIAIDDDPTNVALVDRALAALGAHRATVTAADAGREIDILLAHLLALRSERLLFDDLDVAQTTSADAVKLARTTGDPNAIVRALYTRRTAIWHPSTHHEVMRLAGEMVSHSPMATDHPEFGTVTRLQVFLEQGDFTHYDAELRGMARRIERDRGSFERVWLETARAARALVRGEWALMREHVGTARALASGFEYVILEQLLLAQEMIAAWHTGADYSSLVTDEAIPAGPMNESWAASLLGLSATQLPRADVQRGLDRLLADGIASVRPDLTWGPVMGCLSMAAAAGGATAHARLLHDELLPYADLWSATGGAVNFGPFVYHLGRLALVLGRPEQARRHLDRAMRTCLDADALPWTARVHLALAEVDRERAVTHATAAASIADRLGMVTVAEAAARLLERDAPKRPSGLTPRETEVLRLVAAGLTNKVISERLHLSVATVDRHLLNAYTKIGVHNRSEATAFALRNGLAD